MVGLVNPPQSPTCIASTNDPEPTNGYAPWSFVLTSSDTEFSMFSQTNSMPCAIARCIASTARNVTLDAVYVFSMIDNLNQNPNCLQFTQVSLKSYVKTVACLRGNNFGLKSIDSQHTVTLHESVVLLLMRQPSFPNVPFELAPPRVCWFNPRSIAPSYTIPSEFTWTQSQTTCSLEHTHYEAESSLFRSPSA
jgi:hypothetical protein